MLGAGGAGFVLFFVPKNNKLNFLRAFKNYTIVDFKFENKGTHIILNDQKIWSSINGKQHYAQW